MANEAIQDRELVRRFQEQRDIGAFDELVRRHSRQAYQLAYGTLLNREDAEEVVQDAFLRIYRSLDRFRNDAEFSTWMYRIVVNLCHNKFRWNRVRGAGRTFSLDETPEDAAATRDSDRPRIELQQRELPPDKAAEFNELQEQLTQANRELPEAYRTTLLMRNVQEMDYEQIAAALGLPVGTVKSRINRAREQLRERLGL